MPQSSRATGWLTQRRRRPAALLLVAGGCAGLLSAGSALATAFLAAGANGSSRLQRMGSTSEAAASRQLGHASLQALPWESAGNEAVDRAYAAWAEAYPVAAQKGEYQDEPCDKSVIGRRFEALAEVVGDRNVALEMAEKEPVLMLREGELLKKSWLALKEFELPGSSVTVQGTVLKNPRLLTIPDFEFQRTKPSLESLDTAASAIDALRPLGQGGISVAIFGSFVLLLVVLRGLLYGIGGGKSVVEVIINPVKELLPPIPNPVEYLQSIGISPALIIVAYPLYVVGTGIVKKLTEKKDEATA
eukprot:TRINITY_DN38009_c0_g1_i1.p1 TRINITY_DN38009_c0_g1~~TRINITY_DN38009_c0_g1_i1.p1  ORF type:complete len:303 (-),score=76.04 TRINITY_DN38009_c0_g1_i1:204-1112(-)